MTAGKFITVEGGEGAGKSSCLKQIADSLSARGVDPIVTREPGGTPVGERIRNFLLDPDTPEIAPETELLLVFAARREHIERVIRPRLAAGDWVVSDRFTDASYAYQGGGRGIAAERIEPIEQWTQQELTPDLTLLLDVPPSVGLERAVSDREADRFELEQADFYERVRQAYLARAAREPDRFAVVDASRPLPEVAAAVQQVILEFAQKHGH